MVSDLAWIFCNFKKLCSIICQGELEMVVIFVTTRINQDAIVPVIFAGNIDMARFKCNQL